MVFRLWCIKIWLRPRQGKKALLVWPKSLGLVRYLRPLQSPIPCVLYVNKRAGSHNWEALGLALLTCCLYCLSLALCTVRPGGGFWDLVTPDVRHQKMALYTLSILPQNIMGPSTDSPS